MNRGYNICYLLLIVLFTLINCEKEKKPSASAQPVSHIENTYSNPLLPNIRDMYFVELPSIIGQKIDHPLNYDNKKIIADCLDGWSVYRTLPHIKDQHAHISLHPAVIYAKNDIIKFIQIKPHDALHRAEVDHTYDRIEGNRNFVNDTIKMWHKECEKHDNSLICDSVSISVVSHAALLSKERAPTSEIIEELLEQPEYNLEHKPSCIDCKGYDLLFCSDSTDVKEFYSHLENIYNIYNWSPAEVSTPEQMQLNEQKLILGQKQSYRDTYQYCL